MRYIHGDCGTPCTNPDLKTRDGQRVQLIRSLDPKDYDRAEVGLMLVVEFDDGFTADVFSSELRP